MCVCACVALIDDGDQPRCAAFRGNDSMSRNAIIVTEDALADNNVQFFVDCAQPDDTIVFVPTIVNTTLAIVVNKPMFLRGANGSEVEFGCPPEGMIFDIQ